MDGSLEPDRRVRAEERPVRRDQQAVLRNGAGGRDERAQAFVEYGDEGHRIEVHDELQGGGEAYSPAAAMRIRPPPRSVRIPPASGTRRSSQESGRKATSVRRFSRSGAGHHAGFIANSCAPASFGIGFRVHEGRLPASFSSARSAVAFRSLSPPSRGARARRNPSLWSAASKPRSTRRRQATSRN